MGAVQKEAEAVIIAAVVKTTGIAQDTLSGSTNFMTDLDMKSTNFVHVINDLEEEFEVEVPFMEFRRKKTIDEASIFIETLVES